MLVEVNAQRVLVSERVDMGFPRPLHVDQVDVLCSQAKIFLIFHVLRLLINE